MAVQPQTPYIEHIANGTTTNFNLGFDCDDQDHLIVLVDDVEPVVGSWSLTGGAVVFGAAPTSGRKITVQRNTPFERKRDYQSYDNSFRPPVVNKDFDWIWLKLQELGVADWILGNRITALKNYVDIRDDVIQENIDNLKGYVDLKDDELRAYLMEEIRKQGVALDQLDDYYNYLMQRLAQIAVDKGWDASFVVDASGDNQQQINDKTIRTVATTSELTASLARKNGQEIYVQSRTSARHKGGGRFYFDSSRTDENDGVTVFNGWVRSKSEQLKPEWAGAIGDGIADDSPAFRLINSVGFYAALRKPSNALFKENGYTISLDPNAKYRLVGSDLMGSPLGLDTTEELKRIQMRIEGNGSTIFFDPQNEFDHLFNIDAFIDNPIISDVIIYPRRSSASMPIGMGVIFNLISGYNGLSGAKNLTVSNVNVETVRYGVEQLTARVRRVFQIKGATQADKIRVNNCSLAYFKELYYSENPESVNNVFSDCSFFAGGSHATTPDVRYFHVTKLYDGLSIEKCNATIYEGETWFYGRSPLNSAGTYLSSVAQHRVYFTDNRFEFHGTSDVIMWDSNAWTGVFCGSNLRLAAGGATVTTVFKPFESSALNFERFNFGLTRLYAPITSSISYSGNGLAFGINANNVEFLKNGLTLGVYNGTTEMSIKDALVSKRTFKQINMQNASYVNNYSLFDFQICADNVIYGAAMRKEREVTFSRAGQVFGLEFEIPPYQQIDEVYLSLRGAMPNTFAGFRVWIGKKANNVFFDTPLINPDEIKPKLKLFDGKGIIFTDVLMDNVLTVDALDISGNVVSLGATAEIIIKYKALSTAASGITNTSNTVVGYNLNKQTGVGITAQRPTVGLYLGMQYFDRTLGKPIYCKQVSLPVWVDATGVTV